MTLGLNATHPPSLTPPLITTPCVLLAFALGGLPSQLTLTTVCPTHMLLGYPALPGNPRMLMSLAANLPGGLGAGSWEL